MSAKGWTADEHFQRALELLRAAEDGDVDLADLATAHFAAAQAIMVKQLLWHSENVVAEGKRW